MTDPYDQCSPEQGLDTLKAVVPFFNMFKGCVPEGKDMLYVSAMATSCIVYMCQNATEEAVKLFLERAIADIPNLAKIGRNTNANT